MLQPVLPYLALALLAAGGLLAYAPARDLSRSVHRAYARWQDAPPCLVMRTTAWDFGQVQAGPVRQTRFPIKNAGGRRLLLVRESHSCTCLAGDPELVLPPGARGHLPISLDTAPLHGPLQLEIRYRTNDPQRPLVMLTLMVDVTSTQGTEK